MLRIRPIYWFLLVGFTLLAIFLPIGINNLMSIESPKILAPNGVVTSNDWIGFMGSFIGSLIAGVLTLGGVYLTIKEQRVESMIEKFPKKLQQLDNIYEFFNSEEIGNIKKHNNEGLYGIVDTAISDITRKRVELIDGATEVNGYFYFEIKNIIKKANEFNKEFPREKRFSLQHRDLNTDEYRAVKIERYADFIIELECWVKKFNKMYYIFVDEHEKMTAEIVKLKKCKVKKDTWNIN
ncbi:hypothetical protein [Sporosarcina sp. P7]|uniref:hypothetical protein n=1 Tax=Sporosarcina sp. P7 TaxID=2048244 RepID=UPI000C168AAE|nr:hypothetical protein [Sporosarcina sp. P7]PID23395.1 hypothetical protein CSV60_15010 [Sporosarcina sp. P7]